MSLAQQQAAEKAVADRDRQYRRYRAAKKAELQQLFASGPWGKQLHKFHATLGHFGIDDAERLIAYVQGEARSWLLEAPYDTRCSALEIVGYRIVRVRQKAGLVPFDDALPGEPDDLFTRCKREIFPDQAEVAADRKAAGGVPFRCVDLGASPAHQKETQRKEVL